MSLSSRVDNMSDKLIGIYTINVHSHWINARLVLIPRLSPLSIFLDRYVILIVGGSESHAT